MQDRKRQDDQDKKKHYTEVNSKIGFWQRESSRDRVYHKSLNINQY
jgi:hypothetical protein